MKFRASEEQVKEIVANAILASSPVGMGILNHDPDLTKEQILSSLEPCDGLYVDYFQGRMVKLSIRVDGMDWEITDINPRNAYQSWCWKYKTYEDLVKSVEGVIIL